MHVAAVFASLLTLVGCGNAATQPAPTIPRHRPRAAPRVQPIADADVVPARDAAQPNVRLESDVGPDAQPRLLLAIDVGPLPEAAHSYAVVLVREEEIVGDDLGCDPSRIALEVSRQSLEALIATRTAPDLIESVRIPLGGVVPGTTYLAGACIRDDHGALHTVPGAVASGRLSERVGASVHTPSGTTIAPHVHRGHALIAWDPASEQLVETQVIREPTGGPMSVRALELSDGRTVQVPSTLRVWMPNVNRFVALDHLRPGDSLLAWSGDMAATVEQVRVVRVGPVRRDGGGTRPFNVEYPNTYFHEGLVVSDTARTRASGPPRVHVPDTSPSGAFPEPATDCGLAMRLQTLPVAPDVGSLAVLVTVHEGARGARVPVQCEDARVVREIPRDTVERLRRELHLADGAPLSIVLHLARGDGDDTHCGLPFEVAVCERRSDGSFTSDAVLGRYAESGSAH